MRARLDGVRCPEHGETATIFVGPTGDLVYTRCCKAQESRINASLAAVLA